MILRFKILVVVLAMLALFCCTGERAPDTGPEIDPYVPVPPGRVSRCDDPEVRAVIETAFQKLVDTPVGSDEYLPVMSEVVPIAQQAPEIIVEKLRTGDHEIRRRAIGVMYSFRNADDTSLLVRALVDLYLVSDQGMQKAILIIFGQAHAVPALPFLRQVLEDTRPPLPPPPGREGSSKQMCDTAFNQIASILESLGFKQFMHFSPRKKDIEEMKKWLDSHPEIVDPSGKWKAPHYNKAK